jgi:hypothetical protein
LFYVVILSEAQDPRISPLLLPFAVAVAVAAARFTSSS